MQLLLRISLKNTTLWRLCALDGRADLAHAAALIGAAFGYGAGADSFIAGESKFTAGHGGEVSHPSELSGLEGMIGDNDSLEFVHVTSSGTELCHEIQVMKREEKLFCLVPSVMVGSGRVPAHEPYTPEEIQEFADRDENLTLDIREATARMRLLGPVRGDVSAAMIGAGASPLNFKLK